MIVKVTSKVIMRISVASDSLDGSHPAFVNGRRASAIEVDCDNNFDISKPSLVTTIPITTKVRVKWYGTDEIEVFEKPIIEVKIRNDR